MDDEVTSPKQKPWVVPFLVIFILLGISLGLIWWSGTWQENQQLKTELAQTRKLVAVPAKNGVQADLKPAGYIPGPQADDILQGKIDAPVVMIQYSDLECPYCKKFNLVAVALKDMYGDRLLHVFRNLPLDIHPQAKLEAEIGLCVAKQHGSEAYYKYLNQVFILSKSNGQSFQEADLYILISNLGYAPDPVKSCYSSHLMATVLQNQISQATTKQISGTPTIFIGKKDGEWNMIKGADTVENFQKLIDSLL